MKKILTVLISVYLFFIFVNETKAIIILPAVILVPIVKIVAIIISGFSLPVIGLSAYFHKISNKPVLRGIFVGMLILIFMGLLITIALKIINPSRPLF